MFIYSAVGQDSKSNIAVIPHFIKSMLFRLVEIFKFVHATF